LYSGELLKIYPLRDTTGRLGWYSQSDRLPDGVVDGEWLFVRKSMDYIFELVINQDYATLHESLEKLRRFQEGKMGSETPKPFRIKAEKIYNSLPPLFPFAGTFLLVGLLSLAVSMSGIVKSSVVSAESSLAAARNLDETESLRIFKVIIIIAAVAFFLGLTLVLGLLWVAGGHIPFSNGAETMLSIAWTAALVALIGFRKFPLSIPFGVIVASLATLVAAMGNANPAVTQLMPVLSSPLLSIHVSLMMLSYTALAVIMVNGLCGFCISLRSDSASKAATARMALMSEALMFPTLFLLGSGIIAGSVWANVSWGCYWNWDPKETWALITFLIASAGVHRARLPFLRSPKAYHIYTLVLSASVLFTYFGVNYLLGGMHSYA
jgi:ABC-type transport system involved in cytochrome c biogenesis permease subunit